MPGTRRRSEGGRLMDEYDRVFNVMTNMVESLGTEGLSKQDILPALVDFVTAFGLIVGKHYRSHRKQDRGLAGGEIPIARAKVLNAARAAANLRCGQASDCSQPQPEDARGRPIGQDAHPASSRNQPGPDSAGKPTPDCSLGREVRSELQREPRAVTGQRTLLCLTACR